VIEERPANEQLDSCGLRFAPEPPDQHPIVVDAAANPVPVGVIGVRVAQDLGVWNFGEQSRAKERNRVSRGAEVGERIGWSTSGVE